MFCIESTAGARTGLVSPRRLAAWGSVALAAMTLGGCVTPAQELNFIDHRLMQRPPVRPPATQIAGS